MRATNLNLLYLLALAPLAFLGGCSGVSRSDAVSLDHQAFDGVMLTTEGESVVLREELEDGYALVDFWATWCGPCKAWPPILRQVHAGDDETPGMRVVGVALQDDVEGVARYTQAGDMPWRQLVAPEAFDHATAKRLNITSIPQVYAVFPDGRAYPIRIYNVPGFAAESQGIPTRWGIATLGLVELEEIVDRYGEPDDTRISDIGTMISYRRTSALTDERVETQIHIRDGRVNGLWTEYEHTNPAIVTVTFPEGSTDALDRVEQRLLDARGAPGITYLRYLTLTGTTTANIERQSTFEPLIGRDVEVFRGNPHMQDWTLDRDASTPPGTYRLTVSLVPQTAHLPERERNEHEILTEDLGIEWTLSAGQHVQTVFDIDTSIALGAAP